MPLTVGKESHHGMHGTHGTPVQRRLRAVWVEVRPRNCSSLQRILLSLLTLQHLILPLRAPF